MVDNSPELQHTFRRKSQVFTMETKSSVKIQDEVVIVDPLLLFQRLATASTKRDNMSDIFRYELCSYPPALFESPDMMRQANKAGSGDGLWSPVIESSTRSSVCFRWRCTPS